MKAVLMSMHPEWCELIGSEKKTDEVRKSRPKIKTPFKVYIYCTKDRLKPLWILEKERRSLASSKIVGIFGAKKISCAFQGNGKVIGEFLCDAITGVKCDNAGQAAFNRRKNTCLTDDEIMKYANHGKVYYWHISNLIIYDKPKELSEFYKYTEYDNSNNDIRPCDYCPHSKFDWSEMCEYCEIDFDGEHCIYLQMKRPPQSWCYVEELR